MDPPLANESSFLAANPSSYSLAEIWALTGGLGLRMGDLGADFGGYTENSGHRDGSVEESTLTEHSGAGRRKRKDLIGDGSSRLGSIATGGNNDSDESDQKKLKLGGPRSGSERPRPVAQTSSGSGNKSSEKDTKPDPPKDYIHVRARRGQATDNHSLAERARREKISERMNALQDLVPGCNKIVGKALVLDEIINYVMSLQQQIELEAVDSRPSTDLSIEGFHSTDVSKHEHAYRMN